MTITLPGLSLFNAHLILEVHRCSMKNVKLHTWILLKQENMVYSRPSLTEKNMREGSEAKRKLKKRIEKRRHGDVGEGSSPARFSHASSSLQNLSHLPGKLFHSLCLVDSCFELFKHHLLSSFLSG